MPVHWKDPSLSLPHTHTVSQCVLIRGKSESKDANNKLAPPTYTVCKVISLTMPFAKKLRFTRASFVISLQSVKGNSWFPKSWGSYSLLCGTGEMGFGLVKRVLQRFFLSSLIEGISCKCFWQKLCCLTYSTARRKPIWGGESKLRGCMASSGGGGGFQGSGRGWKTSREKSDPSPWSPIAWKSSPVELRMLKRWEKNI